MRLERGTRGRVLGLLDGWSQRWDRAGGRKRLGLLEERWVARHRQNPSGYEIDLPLL